MQCKSLEFTRLTVRAESDEDIREEDGSGYIDILDSHQLKATAEAVFSNGRLGEKYFLQISQPKRKRQKSSQKTRLYYK